MDHRRSAVFIAVPLSLLLQCLVVRDAKSVAIVRPRRFVVRLPPLVGRGRAAVGPRDDTTTVVGYDGFCRPRFEDADDEQDETDGHGPRHDGDGSPPAPPATTVFDQYDVLLAVMVNINEQYESLMRKLAFIRGDQERFQ